MARYIHKVHLAVSLVLLVLLYGSETWTMRKIDNDRVQSVHMQSQCRTLGVKWYDKITNTAIKETTGLTDLSSLITDRRHSYFSHICRLSGIHQLHNHNIYSLMPSLAYLLPGNTRWAIHGELGFNRWKKTWVNPSVSVNSQS